MELKVDHTPEEALEQIKNKNYKLRFQGKLAEKKVTVKKILGIGISYDRKTKKHSCQVEWLKTKDLYKTIHKASKLKAQKYNKKKWRYVQKQLKKSKKILYSNAATQKSINSAKSDLKKSINKLRRK